MKLDSLSLIRNTDLRNSLMAIAVAIAFLVTSVMPGSAQILKRGVQGGLLGAGVGALVGGGKGAGKGAAIGAAIGAVVGAGEKSNVHAKPQYHETYAPAPNYGPAHGLVYNIQHSLTKLGYAPGPIDGQYGRRTADAIRAYEYNNQLLVTGQPSDSLYNHLVQHGG